MTFSVPKGFPVVSREALATAATATAACVVASLITLGHGRLAVGLVLGMAAGVVAWGAPRSALLCLIAFQIVLGDLRRSLIPLVGWSGQDPLLLVAPAVIGLMAVTLYLSRRLHLDTPLARAVAALMALMGLQMLNPAQGGIAVGVMGALFYLAPLLWFWLGRVYADDRLIERLLRQLVIPLGLVATAFVMYQALVGFLPFEQTWIDTAGYTALYVGDTIRPFGFSTSAAECARLLSMCIVIASAYAFEGSRGALLVAGLAFTGMFVVGSRSPVVLSVLAVAVMWSVQSRSTAAWAPRFAAVALVAVAVLGWGLTRATQVTASNSTVQNAIDHQAGGLLDPGNKDTSTAGIHVAMFVNGFAAAAHTPLGLGLGATTEAAGKLGAEGASSEVDLSDVILSLGLLGGVVYSVVLVLVILMAVRRWRQTGGVVALATLGVLIVCAGQWLRGGEYGTVAIVWFLIGALDRAATVHAGSSEVLQPNAEPCT